jgi:hypothetical protein
MKENVGFAKAVDAKKESSPTRSDNNIQGLRNKPERQFGSLRAVIDIISRDGGKPSVESIATHISSMHTTERTPALLALQCTHSNRYVQRVVTGIQAKLKVGQPGDVCEQEVDQVAEPSRVWDGAIGDQMRTILRLPSAQFVFDRFVGRGRKSDVAELAMTIPHRKMAVDLSNHMISSSALAEAMTNEASRQLDKYLKNII